MIDTEQLREYDVYRASGGEEELEVKARRYSVVVHMRAFRQHLPSLSQSASRVKESRKRCGSYSIKQTAREDIHIWGGVSTIAPVPYDDDETTVVGDSASWFENRALWCGSPQRLPPTWRPPILPYPTPVSAFVVGTEAIFVLDGLADIGWLVCWPSLAEQRTSGKDRQRALYPVGFLASLSRFRPEQLLLTQSEVAVFASTFLLQKKRK